MTASRPTFSVVVPTYNHARYLGAALDSLRAQIDPAWEAVVVDDGSTDDTPALLERYAREDPRIRYVRQPNGGVASALNQAVEHATAPWVCWLSSDDLFAPEKLATHRRFIERHPGCRFFFSHFRTLREDTGALEDPALWTALPPTEFQVLETLRCSFIHGNSICVARSLLDEVGPFDRSLAHGQDYDMWLRLLAAGPARFIPARTCITRVHAAQSTHAFPERGHFDSAWSAIEFLNRRSFEDLFPALDLSVPSNAEAAVVRALEVACCEHAFMYQLGPHPLLFMRIAEWVARPRARSSRRLHRRVARAIREHARRHGDLSDGLELRFLRLAFERPGFTVSWPASAARRIAVHHLGHLRARGDAKARPLERYLGLVARDAIGAFVDRDVARPVVFVPKTGTRLPLAEIYGTSRATLEVARRLGAAGTPVGLLAPATASMGWFDSVPYLGLEREDRIGSTLWRLPRRTVVVAVSRGDFLGRAPLNRVVVYHHDPDRITGASEELIAAMGVPVVCVSRHSRAAQEGHGVPADLLHVVPNGCRADVFTPGAEEGRVPRRLVFAGALASYKGVDIALRAMQRLRARYADASLELYGASWRWPPSEAGLLAPGWLRADGELDTAAIERDVPGVTFRGHVLPDELAAAMRVADVLIMPSRVPETFGLVLLEAQACGCIPVVPRAGGFPEAVQDGVTGHLYEENTPEGLEDALCRLWAAGLPTTAQRREAAAWVQEQFSWDRSAEQLLGVVRVASRNSQPTLLIHARREAARVLRRMRRVRRVAAAGVARLLGRASIERGGR